MAGLDVVIAQAAVSSMKLDVIFDVPPQVAEGLANGSLERVGGVVRNSSSKKVVMWLQEGGSEVSKTISKPPLAAGEGALSLREWTGPP